MVVAKPRTRKSPVAVPESLMKKRKTAAAVRVARVTRATARRQAAIGVRKGMHKRAAAYQREYDGKAAGLVRAKRQARNAGALYRAEEPKLLFVVRVRGIMRVSPKVRKCLQLLRLRQVHNGIFLRANKATLNMLSLVTAFVTYGQPTVKSVRDLIYSRGFAKIDGQRIPLTTNAVIKRGLGKFGITCVEDLVHEIVTVGPNFTAASNFLWPFRLNSPAGGWRDKGKHFNDNGDAGDRAELINPLIKQMLHM